MSVINELKTRGVVRVILAYLAVAWLALQAAEMLLPVYGFGDEAVRNVVAILIAGFPVCVAFSWFFEWTAKGIVKEDAPANTEETSGNRPLRSDRSLNRFTVLVLALAVAFFVVDKFVLDPARDQARELVVAEEARTEALSTPFGNRSIAVLRFRDLSPQGDQGYLSAGVAEEVLNLLTRIPELRVAGRASAFSFAEQDTNIPEIGELLRVGYVLDGSVSRAGENIRVTVQLVDASTDTQLWSNKYDRQLRDIFAVQDEIAARVVSELRLRIMGEAPTAQAIDPVAYEKFLKARYYLQGFTNEYDDKAAMLLDEVLAIEPSYLPALEQQSIILVHQQGVIPQTELEARFRDLAKRMVAIDPDSAETLNVQTYIAAYIDRDPQESVRLLEQALRLAPGNVNILQRATYHLIDLNQFDDAITVARQLVLREPSCGRCINALGGAYRRSGRYREGAKALLEIAQWHSPPPGYYWSLGVLWLGAGEPRKALDAWAEEAQDVGEVWRLLALYDLGREQEFISRFEALRADSAEHPESIARIYAYTGDADKAFEWLSRMFDPAREVNIIWVGSEIYNPIKSDPRYDQMMLEQYGPVPEIPSNLKLELPPGFGGGV